MFDVFQLPFVQQGLIQVLFLAVAGGLLGTWIVLRGLAFYAHAVAAASFPGLVLAGGLGFAAPLGAFAVGGAFAASVGQLSARDRRAGYDSVTALVLVAALAIGVILASDVFHSGAQVDALLFGSLLVVDTPDQILAAVTAVLAVAATWALGPRWLATGFDSSAARAIGVRAGWTDLLLLALVALAAVSALAAVGALLAGALLVIPAATTRLWTDRLRTWQVASVALAAAEGVAGLWLSVELNAPPGATIAVLAGAVFAAAPLLRAVVRVRGALPAVATILLVVLLAGCGTSSSANGDPVAVATTTQIADFVRTVGGDRIQVHQILQPNTDPHEYEPRPNDIRATAGAKVVFLNGDGLDKWMDKVVKQAGGDPKVVTLGDATRTQLPGESGGTEASAVDPHWWHDPRNAEAAVERVRSALGAAVPNDKQEFDRRAAAYVAQIDALDKKIARCFATVPAAQRKLVTSHDAFNYFAKRYGITVVGAIIPSQSTQAQPSAGDVAKLVNQVRKEHVRSIFLESSVNPKLAKAVAAQTGAIGNLELYGDTLGPKGSPGATYLRMEHANADAMMRGFTGGKRGCP
ncbi:MAG TPA: zinc ABC transporter substrate-binding protein [Thermoleophilaceae bacterium]|nr:zinc ABC transporter substrate-binding protein [Thermoleophilaceae bacterium]